MIEQGLRCDAQNCDEIRGYTLAHPINGEVKFCPEHYAKIKEAKDSVILQLLAEKG